MHECTGHHRESHLFLQLMGIDENNIKRGRCQGCLSILVPGTMPLPSLLNAKWAGCINQPYLLPWSVYSRVVPQQCGMRQNMAERIIIRRKHWALLSVLVHAHNLSYQGGNDRSSIMNSEPARATQWVQSQPEQLRELLSPVSKVKRALFSHQY